VALKQSEAATENVTLELNRVVESVDVRDKPSPVATQGSDSTTIVSSRQFATLPVRDQKYNDVLHLVPGVIKTTDGKLNMKGEAENQGMLVVDSAQTVDPVTGRFSVPIPVDAIQPMNVYKVSYSAEYGDFSGGLTVIETKPPSDRWQYGVMDFLSGLRGKNDHLVGISHLTPRLAFGGPILKNKLNFSEDFTYDMRKHPVRGLAWPHDERKWQGFDTLKPCCPLGIFCR